MIFCSHALYWVCEKEDECINVTKKVMHTYIYIYIYVYISSYYGSTTLMQSFGLLNQILPSSSILDKGLPIWHFWLLYIFSNIILPACFWSSCWPSWNGFPGVYCFDHSCFLHPFDVIKPSPSLCSNKVSCVLLFYPIPGWFLFTKYHFHLLGQIFSLILFFQKLIVW